MIIRHSRSPGYDPGLAAAFDRAVTEAVAPYAEGGVLDMAVVARLAWGRPW